MQTRYRWFDQILEFIPGDRVTAVKDVSPTEIFFTDHFPKMPVVPGTVQLEAMLHLSRWLIVVSNNFHLAGSPHTLRGVDFRQFVRSGDQLMFEACIINHTVRAATIRARATVNGRKVSGVKEIEFDLRRLSPDQVNAEKALFEILTEKVPV